MADARARGRVRGAGVVVALLLTAACGDDAPEVAAPPRVAADLAPAAIASDLKLYENKDEATVKAFANVGDTSLVADGRIWEVRRADRLVGALQITTVLPDVDLTDEAQRDAIVRQIIPGSVTRIRIDDVEVYTSLADDKAVFLWFGRDLFEVLQIKDASLDGDYEPLAKAVITHQAGVTAWKPLPEIVEDDGG